MVKQNFDHVFFTPDQLALLRHLFPETVMPYSCSEAQLRHYHGQQSVIMTVKEKTRGYSPQEIPTPGR